MTYEIRFAPAAARQLSTEIPPKVAHAILAFARGDLSRKPRVVGKPLGGPALGNWTAVRGAYRIIYRIFEDRQLVRIVAVKHRSDVYGRGGGSNQS